MQDSLFHYIVRLLRRVNWLEKFAHLIFDLAGIVMSVNACETNTPFWKQPKNRTLWLVTILFPFQHMR